MSTKIVQRFGILFCTLLIVGFISANMSRPPRNNDINNMADALKYLQDLDTFYADRARTRFGKRGSLIQTLKDRLDDADMEGWRSKFLPQR